MKTKSTVMELKDAILTLRGYNTWRRGDENYTQPDPRVIGEAIDAVVDGYEALLRERDEWKAKFIQQNKDLGCELMDPNGTIWDYAKKVQSEILTVTKVLDEARGQRDEWRNEHDRVVREYQHRLCSLATAALEASNYPESESLTPIKTLSNQ
jgi:hypothetical protein